MMSSNYMQLGNHGAALPRDGRSYEVGYNGLISSLELGCVRNDLQPGRDTASRTMRSLLPLTSIDSLPNL